MKNIRKYTCKALIKRIITLNDGQRIELEELDIIWEQPGRHPE